MVENSKIGRLGLIAAALVGLCSGRAVAEDAAPSHAELRPCFSVHGWRGWTSPEPSILYLRTANHDVYRIDLVAGSPDLQRADMHLISQSRGSDLVCSALDLELSLADTRGFREHLIAKAVTRLSTDEVAAIPRKFVP